MKKLAHYQVLQCYPIAIKTTQPNHFTIDGNTHQEARQNIADPNSRIAIILTPHRILKDNKTKPDLICSPLDHTTLLLEQHTFQPSPTANKPNTHKALTQAIQNTLDRTNPNPSTRIKQ